METKLRCSPRSVVTPSDQILNNSVRGEPIFTITWWISLQKNTAGCRQNQRHSNSRVARGRKYGPTLAVGWFNLTQKYCICFVITLCRCSKERKGHSSLRGKQPFGQARCVYPVKPVKVPGQNIPECEEHPRDREHSVVVIPLFHLIQRE